MDITLSSDIIVLLYWTEQLDILSMCQIFRGYFVPRTDTQTDIFSYVHIATGKGGYFYSRSENTVIIFHLVSIIKYNNHQYSCNNSILQIIWLDNALHKINNTLHKTQTYLQDVRIRFLLLLQYSRNIFFCLYSNIFQCQSRIKEWYQPIL